MSQFKDIIKTIDETRVKKSDKLRRDTYIDRIIEDNSNDHDRMKDILYSIDSEKTSNHWQSRSKQVDGR